MRGGRDSPGCKLGQTPVHTARYRFDVPGIAVNDAMSTLSWPLPSEPDSDDEVEFEVLEEDGLRKVHAADRPLQPASLPPPLCPSIFSRIPPAPADATAPAVAAPWLQAINGYTWPGIEYGEPPTCKYTFFEVRACSGGRLPLPVPTGGRSFPSEQPTLFRGVHRPSLPSQYVDALRLGHLERWRKEIEPHCLLWYFPTMDRGAGGCLHIACDHGQLEVARFLVGWHGSTASRQHGGQAAKNFLLLAAAWREGMCRVSVGGAPPGRPSPAAAASLHSARGAATLPPTGRAASRPHTQSRGRRRRASMPSPSLESCFSFCDCRLSSAACRSTR